MLFEQEAVAGAHHRLRKGLIFCPRDRRDRTGENQPARASGVIRNQQPMSSSVGVVNLADNSRRQLTSGRDDDHWSLLRRS
jgi:hypothetical protein